MAVTILPMNEALAFCDIMDTSTMKQDCVRSVLKNSDKVELFSNLLEATTPYKVYTLLPEFTIAALIGSIITMFAIYLVVRED